MKKNTPFLTGSAEVDFTPPPGLSLLGQMHERIAQRARDPLTANAFAVRRGGQAFVLVSVDICMMDAAFVTTVQKRFERRTGWPAASLIIHATHTHVAPSILPLLSVKAVDPAFYASLRDALVETAARAVATMEPSSAFSGIGRLDQTGWNRRGMFRDGTTRMYGHSNCEGFVGMEGPRDPTLCVLFTRDARSRIRTVVVNLSSHPNTLEGESFYSADIPGEVRRVLKMLLGQDVVVVYLTGASGNTAPSLLNPYVPDQPWRGEAGLFRSGLYIGGETAKVIASTLRPMPAPVVRLHQATLPIAIRPWPGKDAPNNPREWTMTWGKDCRAYYQKAHREWPRRLKTLSPMPVRVNVLRVGDAAICTNPAEFFVEHGLDIRALSPARVTLIAQLTDGYVGYVPTLKAFTRGGYETWNAPSSQLVPEAGGRIVDATGNLLQEAYV